MKGVHEMAKTIQYYSKKLVEFKPRKKDAVYGVRSPSGSYRAVVFETEGWFEGCSYMDRYNVDVTYSGHPSHYRGSDDLEDAKEQARSAVSTLMSTKYF